MNPKDVSLGHIIRLIDGPIALIPCVSYKFYERCEECEDEATCGLRNVMAQVREANNKILNNVSLLDITKREQKLKDTMSNK
jgi:DNA-binding IscR family transcriptional regulator